MKKNIFLIIVIAIVLTFSQSCTDKFEEMNVDPLSVNSELIDGALLLPDFFRYGFNNDWWRIQVGENLYANQYCQYFANTQTRFGTDRYEYNSGWAKDFWDPYYTTVLRTFENVKEFYNEDSVKNNNTFQIVKIYKALVTSRVTDYFGDMPYFEAGVGNLTPKYDSQKDIYYDLFKQLKEAVSKIDTVNSSGFLFEYDFIYFNDMKKWITFANSLRLRLAIRISKVDPAKAKLEGEAALAAGVMSDYNETAWLLTDPDDPTDSRGYPLLAISSWDEFRMSKTMEDILENLSSIVDPRQKIWFSPAANHPSNDPDNPGGNEYKGLRNGLPVSEMTALGNAPGDNSNLNQGGGGDNGPFFHKERLRTVMSYAEVCFLKAEAGLRGWAGAGDVQENYEEGIQMAFKETILDGYTFILLPTQMNYINGGDVKFKADSSFETKLEQIIVQKWLALFPEGPEAWAEYRRTGYPELYPVVYIDPSSGVPEGEFIKKLRYIDGEYEQNNANVTDPSLNGGQGDGLNVRVWWDID